MHPYGVREVQKLLRLPRSTIRTLIHAGFVSPARGPRNAWRFSFQDLIVLRTAQALAAAKVPARRIARSMRELRRHLPQSMPLSGLSIAAEADRVVVREGASRWQADSGQYLLAFEGSPADGSLTVLEAPARPEGVDETLDDYIERGCALHQGGQAAEAEHVYREALAACGEEAVLLYNLGIVLEDLERKPEAATLYERALKVDPAFADCHYNLALLCEALGKPQHAIRHMAQYRRLVRKK
ncbi:MAG TPA: tetratricopeptide repeat protein [Burkholderiales bacterium]|nr:tetratricopeptide repeat protein [Burkholderiales bacterium]